MINRLDIRAKVGEIAQEMHDPARAHKLEDDLYKIIITSIASGNTDDPVGLCLEALKTKEIIFSRWYE